jgi:hypothetical protein
MAAFGRIGSSRSSSSSLLLRNFATTTLAALRLRIVGAQFRSPLFNAASGVELSFMSRQRYTLPVLMKELQKFTTLFYISSYRIVTESLEIIRVIIHRLSESPMTAFGRIGSSRSSSSSLLLRNFASTTPTALRLWIVGAQFRSPFFNAAKRRRTKFHE